MEKKVFAFDLDGTITEHRTWITDENLAVLDQLKARGIRAIILGAGPAKRIFTQMREYPIDIIGNYGLQYAKYRDDLGDIEYVRDLSLPCDRESVIARLEEYRGEFKKEPYYPEKDKVLRRMAEYLRKQTLDAATFSAVRKLLADWREDCTYVPHREYLSRVQAELDRKYDGVE